MSSFTGDLITRWRDDDKFEVYTPYRFDFGELGSGVGIYIGKGTVSDLMSLPWLARLIIRRTTNGSICAVPHDKVYATGKLDKYRLDESDPSSVEPAEFFDSFKVNRSTADLVILDAMLTRNMNKFVAYFVYLVLVCFGWIRWNELRDMESEA